MSARLPAWLLSAVLGLAPAAAAESQTVAATPAVLAFEQFIRASAPVCERMPAAACIDAGWGFADANRDDRLSLAELTEVRDTLVAWTGWRGESLHRRERAAIAVGLLLIDSIGLETLVASYNSDADGALSRKELLADVTLDERPLGEVLLDDKAVDRAAVAQRLGSLSPMLEGLLADPRQ